MILEQCKRERRPLPPAIQNAPDLEMGLELFYGAFFDLTSCRSLGMGLGPIPWTAVNQYARAYGYSEEQEEDLQFYISRMDHAYMEWAAKKKG